MNPFVFHQNKIREACGEAAFLQGEAYYRSGLVHALRKEADGAGYRAIVGGTDRREYVVEIAADRDGEVGASCECEAFSPLAYCKHIVAAWLKLAETSGEEKPAEEEDISEKDVRLTRQVIFLFDRIGSAGADSESEPRLDEREDRTALEAAFGFKLVRSFSGTAMMAVSMKIGQSRLYVVQKIKDFLKHVREGTPMAFAKHFAYDPSEHFFRGADAELIALLAEAMDAEEVYKEMFHSLSSSSYREERLLVVPPGVWDKMVPWLPGANATFEDKLGIHRMELVEGKLPIAAKLDRAGDGGYKLEIEGLRHAILLDRYGMAIVGGLLFRAEPDHLRRIAELKKAFQPEEPTKLLIPADQIEPFIDRVVRGLRPMISVDISPQIADRIVNPPLDAKLYLEMEADRLLARLDYEYDETIISPLPQREVKNARDDVLLMRDIDREHRIMSLIEKASFKFNGKEVYLDQEDDIYDFLYGILPQLGDDVSVFATEAVRSITRPTEYEPRARVDVDAGTNWLEVSFDMEGMEEEDVRGLLRNLIEKRKYYRLPGGRFVSLEQGGFRDIARLFDELDVGKAEMGGGMLRLPAVRGFRLMEPFGENARGVQVGKALRGLWDDLRHPDNLEFAVPAELERVLREYQKFGYRWLRTLSHYRLGGILADDMGLGKTIQSIAYLASVSRAEEGGNRSPSLIVCPSSLIYNWEREIRAFSPSLRTVAVTGDPREREQLMAEEASAADVWITSYPLLRRDIEWYERRTFRTLFLDEAQAIKNHASLTSHAVRRLTAEQRFALTGTPIENSLDELWSIFEAVFPGLFGGKRSFSELPKEKVARIVRPFILRRLKSDVLRELPEKIESVHPSELSLEQKKLYLAYLEQMQSEVARDLASDDGFRRHRMKILAGLTRLRQLCCHPSLFLEGYEGTSGKLEQLLELADEVRGSGGRMLVFSQFTSMLELIRKELDERGLSYFYLDGSTPSARRLEMCDAFNAGERDLFLISLKAGGTGLNLTGADTVVLFDLWWNPAVEQQAADRAHRIGQKKVVQVIKLVARGTIEEKMLELQKRKKDLVDAIIQPGETSPASLTEDDIRELLDL